MADIPIDFLIAELLLADTDTRRAPARKALTAWVAAKDKGVGPVLQEALNKSGSAFLPFTLSDDERLAAHAVGVAMQVHGGHKGAAIQSASAIADLGVLVIDRTLGWEYREAGDAGESKYRFSPRQLRRRAGREAQRIEATLVPDDSGYRLDVKVVARTPDPEPNQIEVGTEKTKADRKRRNASVRTLLNTEGRDANPFTPAPWLDESASFSVRTAEQILRLSALGAASAPVTIHIDGEGTIALLRLEPPAEEPVRLLAHPVSHAALWRPALALPVRPEVGVDDELAFDLMRRYAVPETQLRPLIIERILQELEAA
jgi:hypothetical protein